MLTTVIKSSAFLVRQVKNIFFILACFSFAFLGAQKINTPLTYSVHLPSIKTSKAPVLIMLHGYGSNEADLLPLADALDGRFMTFSLRAPVARQGGGYAWYNFEQLPNGERKYDYKEVKQSRDLVLSFISKACAAYHLDSTEVVVLGFSQGAMMCYELGLYAPAKVKALIPLSGRLMTESTAHVNVSVSNSKPKFLVAHGTQDEVIKFIESEKARDFLKTKKMDCTFKSYPMAHSISDKEMMDVKEWLKGVISSKQ